VLSESSKKAKDIGSLVVSSRVVQKGEILIEKELVTEEKEA
jgi:hypothetical protein